MPRSSQLAKPRTNSRIEAGLTKKWIEIKMNCSNDRSWKYRQQFGVENKTLNGKTACRSFDFTLDIVPEPSEGPGLWVQVRSGQERNLKRVPDAGGHFRSGQKLFFLFPFLVWKLLFSVASGDPNMMGELRCFQSFVSISLSEVKVSA